MKKILTSIPVLLALVSWLSAAETKLSSASKPNVVFLLADDMGFSDAGCYGGEIATPNLDSLARDGLRFTQFYNTARCWPSRGALLTGYYAQQIHRDALPGLPGGMRGARQPWARLLPDFLKAVGYRCYHSGKWHIDGKVPNNGFDRSLSINQGNYFSAAGNAIDDKPVEPATNESRYYASIAIADHALDRLKDHAVNHPGQPFFHYVAFTAPHFPLRALPQDIAKYRDKYLAGWEAMREARFDRQKEMGIVNTTLSALERNVGPPYAFPHAIKQLGSGFSSASNTPFRRHKTWVHEGGITTPLIVYWPAGIGAKGELRHTPGHFIDIVPTVLELAGVQKPKEWKGEPITDAPGHSLVPAFAKDVTIPHESLWWYHEGNRALRAGDWKLVAAKDDAWELYDLRTDRAEQENLASKMPDKVKELERVWQGQTDRYTELARETLADRRQPAAKAAKNNQ